MFFTDYDIFLYYHKLTKTTYDNTIFTVIISLRSTLKTREDIMNLSETYESIYHQKPQHMYFAPGRVNLIGEHIDYNGGLVFPAAISLGTYAAIRQRDDAHIHVYSKNFKELGIINIDLENLAYQVDHHYANYIKGAISFIKEKYSISMKGFNLYIEGTLPPQSGLSSSASLLVLIVCMLNDLYHLQMSKTEIALYAQDVENNYMHMHCGIMDQLIIAKGIKDHALVMHTKTLETKPVNAFFKGFTWIIMNTHYPRKTTDSKYNQRVEECQNALKVLKKHIDISHLCDLSLNDFNNLKKYLTNPILLKRAKHAITEQDRVLKSIFALENEDALSFGSLLNASHKSLKEDYEVTGFHLDTLVEGALLNGAIGARVTGAGFGGCAIALVPDDRLSFLIEHTKQYYKKYTQIEASFYQVEFVDGVRKIEDN